jgi:hypothetical protein
VRKFPAEVLIRHNERAEVYPGLSATASRAGFQLAPVIAGGPAPLIATALFTTYKSGLSSPRYLTYA